MKFPNTIGSCIDLMYKLRAERFAFEKKAEVVKEKESALEKHVLESFKKTDLDGARGKVAVAGITQSTVPAVKDWDKLYAYVKKKGAWDLLQRRLSSSAYRERLDQKEAVPGVEPFIVTKLSLKKR